jgi:HEAT repeat protein
MVGPASRLMGVLLFASLLPLSSATPDPFSGARWIWYSAEPMPDSISFPAGTAGFRSGFDVPSDATITSAQLSITADNLWLLHVNGQAAGAGSMDPEHWNRPRRIDISSLLRPGRNVVAVEALNTSAGPSGLIVALDIETPNGPPIRLLSGESWKCSNALEKGWQDPGFDDRKWQAAHGIGEHGMPPWGALRPPLESIASAPPDQPALNRFKHFQRLTQRGAGPPPPLEMAPPDDYPWPAAVAFLADDCSLYRPLKHEGSARDSLSVTIFNPNHTRAYPEHDLPAPVKMGRRLMILRPARPGVTPTQLWDARGGAIGTPAASYDGRWIYFSMAKEGGSFFHIYRIPAAGGAPQQLTDGPFHDIDPCELPDGRLVFSSTRIGVFEEYHNPPSRALFTREADGAIHPLTHTIVFDNEPRVMADGRILFLRSDNFFDRAKVETRLHAIYPDGTKGQNEFGLEMGPEYGGRLRAFNAGSAAPMPDGRVAWVDGRGIRLGLPGQRPDAWRNLPIPAADLAPLPDSRLLATVPGIKPPSQPGEWPFRRIALVDPDAAEPAVVSIYESPDGPLHSPVFVGPSPKPPVLAGRINPKDADQPGQTGIFFSQDVRLTHNHTAGWQHVRGIRVLAGRGLTYRSSHSYLVHAGNETVDLGTVPLAPDGSFAVEVPANTAIAFQAVDAEGRSELNQMSWIYVRPGESIGCVGCHQPRQDSPPPGPGMIQALQTRPLLLDGRGDPLHFRGNNAAVTGLMELQFDRFREIAGLNRHNHPGHTGKQEVQALIDSLTGGDPALQHSAAHRAAVFRDPVLAPPLAAILQSPDREVRVAAALGLAACGTGESLADLTSALADADPLVAQAAAVALENLAGQPPQHFDPFAPQSERRSQLEALHRQFSDTGSPAWQQRIAAGLSGGDRDAARRAAVSLAHCGDRTSMPALVSHLLEKRSDNPFPEWKNHHSGDGTRFNSLAAVNPRSLQAVTRAIGSLGGDGEVPLLAVTAAAHLDPKTGNLFLAEACVEALGRIGTTAAEQALLDLIPELPPYVTHSHWYGDHTALIACHAAPVHALIVEALDRIGSTRAAPHIPALIRMVPTDPDRALFPANDDFETLVGRVIRRSGRGGAVVETCLNLLGDPDAAAPDAEITAALSDVHAAWAGTPGPEIRAAQILSLALRDPAIEPRVRGAFARHRSRENKIPRVYDSGIPVVVELPERHWISFFLARTLGQLGAKESVPTLIAALEDFPAEAAAGRPDPLGPGVLFLHNDLTPCWRAASAWALGRIGDPAATPSLLRIIDNLENATDTRHAAAVALARTARSPDLPALEARSAKVPEVSVRHALIESSRALRTGK